MYSTTIFFYEKNCISFLSCFRTISNYNRAGDFAQDMVFEFVQECLILLSISF